ncbi:MAG: iron-sulfur cluster insertion protein ErpA [Alphaproteobacteria bacterium]
MTKNNPLFTITETAARQVISAAKQDPHKKILRISVDSGGCSGFQYVFSFEESTQKDDLVFEHTGAKVIIDPTSFEFLKNSQLDYVEELIGSYFTIKNPNAQSSCGCGSSFTV